jgi:hypothetical protein
MLLEKWYLPACVWHPHLSLFYSVTEEDLTSVSFTTTTSQSIVIDRLALRDPEIQYREYIFESNEN